MSSILENGLYDKMFPCEFKHLRDISAGSYGKVIEILHKPSGNVFAMKVIDVTEESPEILIRSEIKFLQDLRDLPQKPSIFPHFHGFFFSADETTGKRTFCLVFDLKKRNLNDLILLTRGNVSFRLFESVLWRFINGLAYLQTLQICHRDLKPQNVLIEEINQNPHDLGLTLIDFGISKRVLPIDQEKMTQEMTVIGTETYYSPELRMATEDRVDINPYKSDVFSLGLVMVKLAYGKLPQFSSNMGFEILKLVQEVERKFLGESAGDQNTEKRIEKVMNLLREMLETDPRNRPDFEELFFRSLRLEENVVKIRKMILVKENEGFTLSDMSKGTASHSIEEENKEELASVSQIKETLFNSVDEFLESKAERPPLNLVVIGPLAERIELTNKLLRVLGLKDDLLECPRNFNDVGSPFLLEIFGGQSYRSENVVGAGAASEKSTVLAQSFEEFKGKLKEVLSNQAILMLSAKEKSLIHQKITIKEGFNRSFHFFLMSSEPRNLEFFNNSLARNPTIFLKIRGFDVEKYPKAFLVFFRKFQRKAPCELWTVFWREELFLQSFKKEEKDNEKSFITKKNSKLTKFQEIMKAEEDILGPLTSSKRLFFLDHKENDTLLRMITRGLDFLSKSKCEKALILMLNSPKSPQNMGIPLLSLEKIAEIKEKVDFFSGEFETQIEVFFEKLHQGSLEDMRKNSLFLQELDRIVAEGVDVLRNTETYLLKRNFIKEVLEFLSGSLQDFLRRTIFEMMFPFLEVLIKESIEAFGKEVMGRVFGWDIEENNEEKAERVEKLVLGLILRGNFEVGGRINEKMLLQRLKCLTFKEDAYKQISAYSFWGYEGTKDDILKMVLINLRERKAENIARISEVFNEIAQEYFEKLRTFPGEGRPLKPPVILALQKVTLKAVTAFHKEKKEFFSKENMKELRDEDLKEVLEVKIGK